MAEAQVCARGVSFPASRSRGTTSEIARPAAAPFWQRVWTSVSSFNNDQTWSTPGGQLIDWVEMYYYNVTNSTVKSAYLRD